MSNYSGLDIENARRNYISRLLHECFSRVTPENGKSVDAEESNTECERLTSLISQGLANYEERLKFYLDDLKGIDIHDKKAVQALMVRLSYMENYLMQICRSSWTNEGADRKDDSHEQAGNYIHQEVLTRVQRDFIEGVNLEGTCIMDQLIQDELMTEDERNSIVKGNTQRRMSEEFLRLMMARLNKTTLTDNLIPAIEVNHPDVADKIKEMAREMQEKNPTMSVCAVCNMKEILPVKYLAEHLFSNRGITSDLHEELRSPRDRNASKWTMLLSEVSSQHFILEAIQSRFPAYYERLKVNNVASLECRCQALRSHDLSLVDYSDEPGETDVGNNNLADLESLLDASEAGQASSTPRPVEASPDCTSASSTNESQQFCQTSRNASHVSATHFHQPSPVAQQQPVQFNQTFQTNSTNYSMPPPFFAPGRMPLVRNNFAWTPSAQPTQQPRAFPGYASSIQTHRTTPVVPTATTGQRYTVTESTALDRNGIVTMASGMANHSATDTTGMLYRTGDFRGVQTNDIVAQSTLTAAVNSIPEVTVASMSTPNSNFADQFTTDKAGMSHPEDRPVSEVGYLTKAVIESENLEQHSLVPLTPSLLAQETQEMHKKMIGEALYPRIEKMSQKQTGKITGMLLELDNVELLHMLGSTESLKSKVDEAVAVLEAHQAKEAAMSKTE